MLNRRNELCEGGGRRRGVGGVGVRRSAVRTGPSSRVVKRTTRDKSFVSLRLLTIKKMCSAQYYVLDFGGSRVFLLHR